MKKIIICFVFIAFWLQGCKNYEVHLPLLIGSWGQVGEKEILKSDWNTSVYDPTYSNRVEFKTNGELITNSDYLPLGEGSCNPANSYTLTNLSINLKFSKPQCISIIAANLPKEAKIISLTQNELIIERVKMYKFIRL